MRACATVQQLPCHGSYCELILSLARTSCRLSFPPALLPLVEPAALLLARCPTCSLRNMSKSTLAHDAVAAVVLHKHHLIIRVGAGLIQFVYGSHSRMAADLTLDTKIYFCSHFRGFSVIVCHSSNSAGQPIYSRVSGSAATLIFHVPLKGAPFGGAAILRDAV